MEAPWSGIMNFRYLLLFIGLLLTSFCQAANNQPLDSIYAVVNDDVITRQEFEAAKAALVSQLKSSQTLVPGADILDRQILDRLIIERLQMQVARRKGIRVSEEELNQAIAGIATRNRINLAELRQRLAEQGRNYADFRQGIRHKLIIRNLVNLVIRNRLQVSPTEIDDFLANERQQGNLNEEYDLSHISVSIPEGASVEQIQQARDKAEKALNALHEGGNFGQISAQFSDASNALEGGHLGWLPGGQLPILFTKALTRMKTGDISYLIRAANGYHILRLNAKRGGQNQLVSQTHIRHILMHPDSLLPVAEMMARLRQIRQRILNGEKFSDLAVAYSQDNRSRLKGGDLGWLSTGEMPPEVESVMQGMKPGEISPPIRTSYGAHLVQVLARRKTNASQQRNENMAREQILTRKFNARYSEWIRNLRNSAFVKVLHTAGA